MSSPKTRIARNAALASLTAGAIALTVFSTVSLAAMGSTTSGYSTTASTQTASSASSAGGSSETLTCPATGCTASTCHATQGGSGSMHGHGFGG